MEIPKDKRLRQNSSLSQNADSEADLLLTSGQFRSISQTQDTYFLSDGHLSSSWTYFLWPKTENASEKNF